MFISKIRSLVVTQHEHSRMAGTVALLWGNSQFERPVLDFDAFVAGVTLHDYGYGILDNLPIGIVPDEQWLEVIRKGFEHRFVHPVTDIIVKLHIRRLLNFRETSPRKKAVEELDDMIADRVQESGYSLSDFLWADRITNICDYIAFYFAFEEPITKTFPVFSRRDSQETTEIEVRVNQDGEVNIQPWPLQTDSYEGFLFAYKQAGYPQELDPVIRKYRLVQA